VIPAMTSGNGYSTDAGCIGATGNRIFSIEACAGETVEE
jgi:hypothetical protein